MNSNRLIGVIISGLMILSIGSAYAQTGAPASSNGSAVAALPVNKSDPAAVQAKLDNVQQQIAVINQFTDKFQADAAVQYGVGFNALEWKRDFGSRLMYQPVQSLSSALTAPNLSMAQNELHASSKIVAKHLTNSGWIVNFLSAPCRIVDTRFGGGGVLGPTYRFWTASTATAATIAAQGGNVAGCGSFPNADGFLLYVTVVPTGPGGPNFLTVQHDPSPAVPTSSTMNYYGQNIANFAITACNGCAGSDGGFYAYASSNTNVVVDLLAWTGTPTPAALTCSTQTTAINFAASPSSFDVITPACPAGSTLTGGGMDSNFSTASFMFYESAPVGATWECRGRNVDYPATWTGTCYAICCSRP